MSFFSRRGSTNRVTFLRYFCTLFRKKEGKEVLLIMKKMLREIVKIQEDYIGEFRKKYNYNSENNGCS